jgi:two-component system response regulator PilR (NtrC family)
VQAGRFREDLYYRLNVIQLRVPPLRERREDVLLLAEHFLRRFGAEHGRGQLALSREAKKRLDEYDFPGNVRELENLIERAVTLSDGPEVTLDALPAPLRPKGATGPLAGDGPLLPGFSLEAHLSGIEQALIERALSQAGGVKKNAAALLGLTFRQFRHRLKKLSGDDDEETDPGDRPA